MKTKKIIIALAILGGIMFATQTATTYSNTDDEQDTAAIDRSKLQKARKKLTMG